MSRRQIIHGFPQYEGHPHIETLVRQDEHHIAGKRLGRHIEHDMRSRQYAVKVEIADLQTLKSVLHKREEGPLDQAKVGACTGNAMLGVLGTDPFWKPGMVFNEELALELYHEATILDKISGTYPPDDTGSTGLAVMKAATKNGYIAGYQHAFSIPAVLKALQTVPVITGCGWYDSFDSPDSEGKIEIKPGAVVRGGHEWEINGIALEFTSSGAIDEINSWYNCWNSWGSVFGVGGQFKMSVATHRVLMSEYGDVTVPISLPTTLEG